MSRTTNSTLACRLFVEVLEQREVPAALVPGTGSDSGNANSQPAFGPAIIGSSTQTSAAGNQATISEPTPGNTVIAGGGTTATNPSLSSNSVSGNATGPANPSASVPATGTNSVSQNVSTTAVFLSPQFGATSSTTVGGVPTQFSTSAGNTLGTSSDATPDPATDAATTQEIYANAMWGKNPYIVVPPDDPYGFSVDPNEAMYRL